MPLSFFDRILGRTEKSAKSVAKDRLRLVLLHDRADIPAPVMEEIRREILLVLSKHLDIDEAMLDVSLDSSDETVALIANIPIRRVLPRGSDAPVP
jgi:cell division topological specificity factor